MLEKEKFRESVIFLLYKNEFEDIKLLNLSNDSYKKAIEVINNYPLIDEIITKHLEGYTITRLPKLDLAIIRYAVYELVIDKLDKKIVINEAIDITKKYSDINDKQYKFNNALLDKIANA